MPSEHQNANETDYRNEADRVFKCDLNPVPMIRGVESKERIKMYWNEAHRNDASERVKELIKIRMRVLK